MRYINFLPVLFFSCLSITALTGFKNCSSPGEDKLSDSLPERKGFAVLELFTSEGCSSCPPADALMAKIQDEYKDQPVYLLAYHVDYWDRLGWKDVFSNPDYSNRQKVYGDQFKSSSIYTPQVIVNGASEFVGSNESKIRNAISKALATDYGTTLAVQANKDNNKLMLNYQVSSAAKDSRLLVAILQKSAKTTVERGENKGRLLSHVQIVRSLQSETINKDGKGTASIKLPQEFNSKEWEIIAVIQDIQNGRISTATRVNL